MNNRGLTFIEIMVASSILMIGMIGYMRISKVLFIEESNVKSRFDSNRVIQEIVDDLKVNSIYMVPHNPNEINVPDSNITEWERSFFSSNANKSKFAVRCFNKDGLELGADNYGCHGDLEKAHKDVNYIAKYFKVRAKVRGNDPYPLNRFHLWISYRGVKTGKEDRIMDFFTRVYKVDTLSY